MPTRILLIEDHPDNLELMRYLLDAHGCSVSTAQDGKLGMKKIRGELPDLVVCDIQLPIMDGYQVIREAKNDPATKAIPLIAVTAFAMDSDRREVLSAGFDGYITKPITPESFVDEILAFLPERTTEARTENGSGDGEHTGS